MVIITDEKETKV